MVDAMPGCAWGWLRPSRAVASRAAQAGGLGKREAAEPAPRLSHQPGVHRCCINHLTARPPERRFVLVDRGGLDVRLLLVEIEVEAALPRVEVALEHGLGRRQDPDVLQGLGAELLLGLRLGLLAQLATPGPAAARSLVGVLLDQD